MPSRDEDVTRLIEEHGGALLRFAYLVTGDWGHAEDVLQDALARTWAGWHRVRDTESGAAYVRTAIAREAATRRRRRVRTELVTADVVDRPSRDEFRAVEERAALGDVLGHLTSRQRTVLVMLYYEDMSERDVARALRCSQGTVKSTASRALAHVRQMHSTSLTVDS